MAESGLAVVDFGFGGTGGFAAVVGELFKFYLGCLLGWLFGWLPGFATQIQSWLEPNFPASWLWLLARSYAVTDGLGRPQSIKPLRERSPHQTNQNGDRELEKSVR